MAEQFHKILFEILLLWLISIPPTTRSASIHAMSNEIAHKSGEKIYVQPSELVVREKTAARPILYHFITDYPHPHIPTNNYIKPWELVASKAIRVKNSDDANSRILKKNNILYLDKSDKSDKSEVANSSSSSSSGSN